MSAPALSIVIPAYNEAHRIEASLEKLSRFVQTLPYPIEVIIVDDGSTDSTLEILRKWKEKEPWINILEFKKNQGKGRAVREGMRESHGEAVLFTDADLSIPIEESLGFLEKLRESDVIIGTRNSKGGSRPLHRKLVSRMFNFLQHLLSTSQTEDGLCGFKMFNRKAVNLIVPLMTVRSYAFDIEMLVIAHTNGLTIQETSVAYEHNNKGNINLVSASWLVFLDLIKISLKQASGSYRTKTTKG